MGEKMPENGPIATITQQSPGSITSSPVITILRLVVSSTPTPTQALDRASWATICSHIVAIIPLCALIIAGCVQEEHGLLRATKSGESYYCIICTAKAKIFPQTKNTDNT